MTDATQQEGEAIRQCEERYGMQIHEAMELLKEHAEPTYRYFQDSGDNMDGWEDNYIGFYSVMFDMATYFKHGDHR